MLVANMVGRNEADRYLPEVLDHLRSFVDTIVFTDDGSDDDTPEVAKKYGAKVYRNEVSLFTQNEAQLRTTAWKNLEKHVERGDWVLAIDCDEKLWSTDTTKTLSKMLNQSKYDVINITFYHMWDENHYRVDKAWAPTPSTRLFRYYYGGQFQDRKLACGSEPTYVRTLTSRGSFMQDSGLIMQHFGYMRDEDKQAKYNRYMKLDGGEFHAKQHIESILDPHPTLVEWIN